MADKISLYEIKEVIIGYITTTPKSDIKKNKTAVEGPGKIISNRNTTAYAIQKHIVILPKVCRFSPYSLL